jgi:hypothetical protein
LEKYEDLFVPTTRCFLIWRVAPVAGRGRLIDVRLFDGRILLELDDHQCSSSTPSRTVPDPNVPINGQARMAAIAAKWSFRSDVANVSSGSVSAPWSMVADRREEEDRVFPIAVTRS